MEPETRVRVRPLGQASQTPSQAVRDEGGKGQNGVLERMSWEESAGAGRVGSAEARPKQSK